jgi:hypothetical protein
VAGGGFLAATAFALASSWASATLVGARLRDVGRGLRLGGLRLDLGLLSVFLGHLHRMISIEGGAEDPDRQDQHAAGAERQLHRGMHLLPGQIELREDDFLTHCLNSLLRERRPARCIPWRDQ